MRSQVAQPLSTEESQNGDGMSSLPPRRGFLRRFQEELRSEKVLSYLTDVTNKTSEALDLEETVPFGAPGERPIVYLESIYRAQDKFISLQKWEGVVLKVFADSFLARLYDLTNRGIEEEVELPLEEISDGDKDLV